MNIEQTYVSPTIGPAGDGDRAEIRSLLAEVSLPADGLDELPAGDLVAARVGDRVVGCAALESHGDYGLLRSVVVHRAYRGRGLGAALVADRLDRAHRRGLAAVYLLTLDAETYFARFGFRRGDRESVPPAIRSSSEYAELCPGDAVLMRLGTGSGSDESDAQEAVAADESADELKTAVRRRYAEAARQVADTEGPGGCGSGCGCGEPGPAIVGLTTTADEAPSDVSPLPAAVLAASMGCGDPTALAELRPGEVVLDLGSGGGLDVLRAARRVAPGGVVYGLDMTDEMLALARANQRRAGISNAEFLKGDIEDVPLADETVDTIISNCVINLAADKRKVIAEAFRVLRPGGRLAVFDIVSRDGLPEEIRANRELWTGCLAGALEEHEYGRLLERAGFRDVSVEPARIYDLEDARRWLENSTLDRELAPRIAGRLMSAFVRARKPDRPA